MPGLHVLEVLSEHHRPSAAEPGQLPALELCVSYRQVESGVSIPMLWQ